MRLKTLALKLVAVAVLAISAIGQQASASVNAMGPEVPFPLSTELPFPWGTIEGVWEAKGKGIDALFSFEVETYVEGIKFLKVIHLDSVTGEVMASGVGLSTGDDRIVRAAMKGIYGNYMLFIGAFEDANALPGANSVTGLTIRSFEMAGDMGLFVVVKKISNRPYVPRR